MVRQGRRRARHARALLGVAVCAIIASVPPSAVAGGPAVTVAIDTTANRRPISQLIYGANFATDHLSSVHYPVNRWGGNTTTRYSWMLNAHNSGSDWYFINSPDTTTPGATLPNGSASDVLVQTSLASASVPLLTVPLIGWTAKSQNKLWSYSIAKYGPQQANECTSGVPGCSSDAGNGVSPSGTNITTNDPHDTSSPIDATFVTSWIAHLKSNFGAAASGGVKYYMLDNEPTLWNSTHRDVHPAPVGYDELWSLNQQYASAIKTADPGAQTMGPSAWGWCAYFYSGKDAGGCGVGPDQAAHGNVPLLAWYLQQNCAAGHSTGTLPVDWLDIHYYPQASGVYSSDESAATAALRLRSLKSLYDPTYVDESWIGQAVELVPRMKQLIAANCPSMKLSVSEYAWGSDDGISSAVAQAEALAIFGREGADLAARWAAPAAGTKVEEAFLMYLDYDGAGGKVTGTSVKATSSSVDSVGSYGVVDTRNLYVLLFNKTTADTVLGGTLAGSNFGATASAYRFDGTHSLGSAGTVSTGGAVFQTTLPAMSATLLVVPLQTVAVPSSVPLLGLALLLAAVGLFVLYRDAPHIERSGERR